MRTGIPWGRQRLDVDVAERNLVAVRRQPSAPPVADVAAAVRQALESPLAFPPLRRALTPDDHVAIVIDEGVPQLAGMLGALLDHLRLAQVAPEAVTLVCPPPSSGQRWLDDLPDDYQDVQVEVHQPGDRKKLSYLATTRKGRRIYLNRTVVDADQTVVLARRRYDTLLGVSGAETMLYPALADEETFRAVTGHLSARSTAVAGNGTGAWPLREEAVEVAWLLGAPFLVQVIEGSDTEVDCVLAGPVESSSEGQRLLDARWRVDVERAADLVVAGLSGAPGSHSFDELARAFLAASRVVKPGGRIVVLCNDNPALGASSQVLRREEDATQALKILLKDRPDDLAAGFAWATAAEHARLYLLSQLPDEAVEEMFATPLEKAEQVQRLIGPNDTCLFLPDAHRTMAVVAGPA